MGKAAVADVPQKSCSYKLPKTLFLESPFNRVKTCNFIGKGHLCFPVSIEKFLRPLFSNNMSIRLFYVGNAFKKYPFLKILFEAIFPSVKKQQLTLCSNVSQYNSLNWLSL